MTHNTHNDENDLLARWAESHPAPRGRQPEAGSVTAHLFHFLCKMTKVPIKMACGKFYQFDKQENMEVRLPEGGEAAILKLARRGYIERRGGFLKPTPKAMEVIEKHKA